MLNYITIQGRLTRDPELKTTGNGNHVTSFTVACQRNYQSNGERITDFIDCVAWRAVAERISKFWKKGQEIVICGSLESRKYTDRNGNNRTAWEVKVQDAYFTNRERQEAQEFNQAGQEDWAQIPDDEDLPF